MRLWHDRTIACWCRMLLLAAGASLVAPGSAAAQKAFPFDAELRLEARPLPGSKRVPWLQFSEDGSVEIDLWCARGRGRAVVVEKALTIVPVSLRDDQCPQDRLKLDKEFLDKAHAGHGLAVGRLHSGARWAAAAALAPGFELGAQVPRGHKRNRPMKSLRRRDADAPEPGTIDRSLDES